MTLGEVALRSALESDCNHILAIAKNLPASNAPDRIAMRAEVHALQAAVRQRWQLIATLDVDLTPLVERALAVIIPQ